MEKADFDLPTFTQDNINAVLRANAAFAKGIGDLSTHFFALAGRSAEDAADVGKRLASVKSFKEAFEIQTQFAQRSIEALIYNTQKTHELSAAIAKDYSAPLAERSKESLAVGAAAIRTAANPAADATVTKSS